MTICEEAWLLIYYEEAQLKRLHKKKMPVNANNRDG